MNTNALVIVESMWGNTRAVAEAVAAGIGAECTVLDVQDAPSTVPDGVSLVVLGGPTHALSMSRQRTREGAVEQGAPAGHSARGLREWLGEAAVGEAIDVATFDTKVLKGRRFAGSAAKAAAKSVQRHDLGHLVATEDFYVSGTAGPLVPGELERAREWGSHLVEISSTIA
ncbi:flavodoxin family protein [Marmoricola sp. URHB0036]|uniref:flavodoxin family protein n=1 Tax=Marmoricola sp. URHB0036 TaxID=1298863 RepID=UPI000403D769|nr:flavodoxin family protein [Marmoricola sp. URHB0036]